MKVVVAIDSLKGSLSSLEAGEAIKDGILKAMPEAKVDVRPLADGGEGTVEALALGMGEKLVTVKVTGPLGESVDCVYGILEESKTAIIEMSGAAGGMGFAFLAYTNAVLESGIKIILEETNLESYVKDADIVITGEGRLDGQTAFGKAPIGVAKIAKKYNKTVLAFAGAVTEDAILCNEHGIDAFFPILRNIQSLQEVMEPSVARNNMVTTVEQVFRLIDCM